MDCWLYKPKNYFLKKVGIEKNPFHDSAPMCKEIYFNISLSVYNVMKEKRT